MATKDGSLSLSGYYVRINNSVPRIFHWAKTEGPILRGQRSRVGLGVLGEGQAPYPPARGPGERCELPSRVRGVAPIAPRFSLF